MKYDAWRRAKRVETEFKNSLILLCKLFNKIAESSGEDQAKYVRRMHNFQNSVQYGKYVTSIVKRMVTPLYSSNEATWRKAAAKATRGSYLYNLLMEELKSGKEQIIKEQLAENANLIVTLPSDVANKVVHDIAENALKGKRASSIEKVIREQTDKHAKASARLIARTEVAKTQSAIIKARCEALDLRWYIWRTAQDGNRVRKSHQIMEDVVVAWSNPPSPEALAGEKSVGNYHAGNIWNCRCYPEPLLAVEDIKWPHKVYYNGSIQKMSKKQFMEIM